MTRRTFLLPDLGEGLTEAEVVRWLVAEGDLVTVDQVIVEVETAKAVVDVPTPFAGRVGQLHAAEGQAVDVGRPLFSVVEADVEAAESGAPAAAPSATPGLAPAEAYREEERAGSGNVLIGYGTTTAAAGARRRRPRAAGRSLPSAPADAGGPAAVPAPRVSSPLVRRLARNHGLDLHTLSAQRGGAVIDRAAVLAAARTGPGTGPAPATPTPAAAPAPPPASGVPGERRTPLSGFRKAVSTALTRSRAEIPEATVWVDVDATELVALRSRAKETGRPVPGLSAYLARFTLAGLRAYPVLNSRVDTERQEIVELERIHLGIAVQSPRGLVVPAVQDAGAMTTAALDTAIADVVARAREGRVTPEELTSGTFTLNNYGSFGVDGSAAIINHPQVAMVGFGRILDRPWVVGGEIVVRKIVQMSFVFDHRVCDGGTAAGFMRLVADAVEQPAAAIAHL